MGFLKAIIEVVNRNLERIGQSPDHRRRDPIGAALVLLDLLEGYATKLSQLTLGKVQFPPPVEKSLGEVKIDVVAHGFAAVLGSRVSVKTGQNGTPAVFHITTRKLRTIRLTLRGLPRGIQSLPATPP